MISKWSIHALLLPQILFCNLCRTPWWMFLGNIFWSLSAALEACCADTPPKMIKSLLFFRLKAVVNVFEGRKNPLITLLHLLYFLLSQNFESFQEPLVLPCLRCYQCCRNLLVRKLNLNCFKEFREHFLLLFCYCLSKI